jgi:penicillin G amidase
MKRIGYLFLALLAIAVLSAAALLGYLRTAAPKVEGTFVIAGLGAPVEVGRDSMGVPHIRAESEADLLRALGFVHAQDRLFQMEMFRRVADGRLAEILGPDLVDSDRFLRTVGLGRAAAENERWLGPDERRLLEAYAGGVNAWIETHHRTLPPEFIALRFRPEPWTVRQSLAIGKIMAWDLSDWQNPLDLQRAVDRVGPDLAEALRPAYPGWGDRILGDDARWEARAHSGDAAALPLAALGIPLPRIPTGAYDLIDAVSIARASNSWVIGGELTRSGKPILANDMHLALRSPSLWYLAALHGGGIEAVGMTLPGTPGVIVGRTRRVAWGFTNAMVADADFFVEKLDSTDVTRYLAPDGWRRFDVRAETIQVKGGDPVIHEVRSTRNGPVLSDAAGGRAGDRVLALRWTALEPSGEAASILGMNRARNAGEFLRAARTFDSPHQNIVFADADGVYGYRLAGKIPVRRSGDGRLPVPGWTGDHDWVRYLAPEEHPEIVRVPGAQRLAGVPDFIVTANNKHFADGRDGEPGTAAAYPFLIARTWFGPFRAQRIREMIEAGSSFTVEDVSRQQVDLRDAFAERYLHHAVRAAEAAGQPRAADSLRAWDAVASLESHAAALFYTWYEALRRRVGEDEYRGETMYFPRAALNRILEDGGGAWVDDVRTPQVETLDDLAAAAMREAVREVGGRRWGDFHSTSIQHPLGSAATLDRVLGLNIQPFSRGGSPYTVNVAAYGNQRPFLNTYGASQRHVIDLADPDAAGGFVLPTGQSGLPFARHYRSQNALWREGRLWRVPLDARAADPLIVHRMVLRP